MPRFTKEAHECENDFERWLYLIKNMKMLKRVWDKLLEVADVSSLNEEEKAQYHRALKNYRDYHNVMATARQEGREEGRKEGREEAVLQNARNFKRLGVSTDIIMQATGLSEEEIQQL